MEEPTTTSNSTQEEHTSSNQQPQVARKKSNTTTANSATTIEEEEEEFNQKIILLCHFCERDGPSVLFCTQNIHHHSCEAASSATDEVRRNEVEGEHIESIINEHQKEVLLYHIKHATLDGNQLFISSHRIKHPHTSKFKSLSLRSLSVEYVGPGREGPVLFGDETSGYNLAYIFKLKDSKARGFARWYSFVLMDRSLASLTLSWSFVQKAFCHIVKCLKKRSQEIFIHETQQQQQQNYHQQIQQHQMIGGLASSGVNNANIIPMLMSPAAPFMYRKMTKRTGPLRPLPELLQHDTLYADLHSWNSVILRSFCDRMIELDAACYLPNFNANLLIASDQQSKHVHAQEQSIVNKAQTQIDDDDDDIEEDHQQLQKEEEAETEDQIRKKRTYNYFINSFNQWSQLIKRLIKDHEHQKSRMQVIQQMQILKKQNLLPHAPHSDDTDIMEALLRNDHHHHHSTHYQHGYTNNHHTASNAISSHHGHQHTHHTQSDGSIDHHNHHTHHHHTHHHHHDQQQLHHMMLSHNEIMETLTYNTLVGNQIIIRSNEIHLANDIFKLYTNLVPAESIRCALNSNVVKKGYEANFLTIDQSVTIPEEIDYQTTVLLDLTFYYDVNKCQYKLKYLNMIYEGQVIETSLGDQIKQLYTKSALRYHHHHNSNHSHNSRNERENMERVRNVEACMILALREEWIGKAKLLVRAVKSKANQGEHFVVGQLLQMIHLSADDLPVLQNYSTGLWKSITTN